MTRRSLVALGTLTALLVSIRASAQQIFDTGTKQRIRVVTVATGLVHPWSIAFLPDGHTMLVAEQAGRLRIIRDGVLDPQPIWEAPAPPKPGNDNLHSVAVHPQFAQNRLVYVSIRSGAIAVIRWPSLAAVWRAPSSLMSAKSLLPMRGRLLETLQGESCSVRIGRYT
jgi:hypothetical protein